MNKQEKIIVVTNIINKFDPEGLLELGAPKDEYSYEIKDIAKYDIDSLSEEELAYIIQKVFTKWLGRSYKIEYCIKMSSEIKAGLR